MNRIFFILFLFFISCEKDEENPVEENPLNISFGESTFDDYGEIAYQDRTVVLNNNLKNNLTAVNDNHITFNYSNSFDLLEEGDVLFSGQSELAPNGFARKIISIEKNNNTIKFNTIQATAEEVFEKVDYQQELNLDFENITNLNGSDSTAARSNLSPSKSVQFNVNNDRIDVTLLFDYDNNFQTEIDQLELSGFVEISHIVSPSLVYNFDVFDSSNNLLSISGLSDIKVGGELTYGGKTSNEFIEDDFINAETNQPLEIDKWFNLISIPLTGLYNPSDLIIQPEIVIFARFKIDITGRLYVEFSKDYRYNYVASYQGANTGNGWDNTFEELLDDSWSFDYGATAEINFEATPFAVGPIVAFPQFLFQGNNPSYLGIFIYPWTQKVDANINFNSSSNCFETNIIQQNKWEAKLEANISTIFNNNSSINIDIPLYSESYFTDENFSVPDFCFDTNSLPIVTTTQITNITMTSASGGGEVTGDGGSPINAKGVCWSTNPTPTVSDNLSNDGSGSGAFSSVLSSLNPDTTYYVRAYATNAEGTVYGNQQTFSTNLSDGYQDNLTRDLLTGGDDNSKTWKLGGQVPFGIGFSDNYIADIFQGQPSLTSDCIFDDTIIFSLDNDEITFEHDNQNESAFNIDYVDIAGGTFNNSDQCLPYDTSGIKSVFLVESNSVVPPEETTGTSLIISNGGFMIYYMDADSYEIISITENSMRIRALAGVNNPYAYYLNFVAQ